MRATETWVEIIGRAQPGVPAALDDCPSCNLGIRAANARSQIELLAGAAGAQTGRPQECRSGPEAFE